MKKQSSIEFIVDNLLLPEYGENPEWVINIIQQAKQMHKQEIEYAHLHNRCSGDQSSKCFIEALENAQQYYNETFKSE